MQFVRQRRCCSMISSASCLQVRRKEVIPGGTRAAISAMRSSLITPGPLGICDTNPNADAPHSIAMLASSTLAIQQIFTRGVGMGCIRSLVVARWSFVGGCWSLLLIEARPCRREQLNPKLARDYLFRQQPRTNDEGRFYPGRPYSPYGTQMFFTCVACCRYQRPSACLGSNQSMARPSLVNTCLRLPTEYAL